MENAIEFIFQIVILIFSVVIHEVSHGYAALILGDKTAQYEGRLTLNPIKHLDPLGSVIIPFLLFLTNSGFLFGWAKPVPYNPYNLRDQKWGPAIVGAAGPLANIVLALFFGILIRVLPSMVGVVPGAVIVNFLQIATTIVLLNLVLALFNMVPIPPLDGSKVFFALLPYQWRSVQFFLEEHGLIALVVFILFFSHWLMPVVLFLFRIIAGMYPVF